MPIEADGAGRELIQPKNSRDTSRVAPLRIGGRDEFGRQRVASPLELAGDPAAPVPAVHAWADWQAIATVAGLNRLEKSVFFMQWRDGQKSAAVLGVTHHQLGAANREIARKLRKHAKALRPFLCYLSEPEIILEENFVTDRNQAHLGDLCGGLLLTLLTLNENLGAETAKLERIQERVHTARRTVEESERALETLDQAGKSEQVEAVLAEKMWPTEQHEKKISAARAKIATTQSALTAARTALNKQADVVTKLEQQVEARRHEAFLVEFDPTRAKMLRLMSEFAEACLEVRMVSSRHGLDGYKLAYELFPYGPDAPMTEQERGLRIALMNNSYNLSDHLGTYYARAV